MISKLEPDWINAWSGKNWVRMRETTIMNSSMHEMKITHLDEISLVMNEWCLRHGLIIDGLWVSIWQNIPVLMHCKAVIRPHLTLYLWIGMECENNLQLLANSYSTHNMSEPDNMEPTRNPMKRFRSYHLDVGSSLRQIPAHQNSENDIIRKT